jgi:hypothetical protein
MSRFAVTKASLRDDHWAIRRYLRNAEAALKANDLQAYMDAMFDIESLASASRCAAEGGE